MKYLKKLFSLCLVLALCLSLASVAFAAAASAAGAQLVVIRRPPEQGETASEVLKRCKEMIR